MYQLQFSTDPVNIVSCSHVLTAVLYSQSCSTLQHRTLQSCINCSAQQPELLHPTTSYAAVMYQLQCFTARAILPLQHHELRSESIAVQSITDQVCFHLASNYIKIFIPFHSTGNRNKINDASRC